MEVRLDHLSNIQTHTLLAMFLSGDPESAAAISTRNARTSIATDALEQMGMVDVRGSSVHVTTVGVEELRQNGYIGDDDQLTDYGERFYQKSVSVLNEEFQLIKQLIR